MSTLDFRGARGSNAGDEFHELWAVRQALALLPADTALRLVTVEGLRTADEAGSSKESWDGVDCGLYFSGSDDTEPNRLEICQLKYSAANPETSWSVSRFSTGTSGAASTSPIRRLANAFREWVVERGHPVESVRVRLISNQPVSNDLLEAVAAARGGVPAEFARTPTKSSPDLHRLVHASGLEPVLFQSFASRLDLEGDVGSRFAFEEQILSTIADWADTEVVETEVKLRKFVRDRMLPESAGHEINRQSILVQFGVSIPASLFPCPPLITFEQSAAPREIVQTVLGRMLDGVQFVCLHGGGGVGKTTTLQELKEALPDGSVLAVLDCYGRGSFLDSNAYRHRPEDAFLQLTNDIAATLRLPLLLTPSRQKDHARRFHQRLRLAASALAAANPSSLLVVAVDAADNSVTAAEQFDPPEVSFVHDFVRLNDLPSNVRVFVSARTSRVPSLRLPSNFEKFAIEGFSRSETAANVSRYWPANDAWIDDFHSLSQRNPRVQGYALQGANGDPDRALELLRPNGKGLEQVFKEQFAEALKKNGLDVSALQSLCAALVILPRPIPLRDLAAVASLKEDLLREVCIDLAPGLRVDEGNVGFADEEFEHFVRGAGDPSLGAIRSSAAQWFLGRTKTDAYAAMSAAPALLAAGQRKELLALVEDEPEPASGLIPDPVRRAETHTQRLQLAIRVCREAGDATAALKFVVIGAEAIRRDDSLRSLLRDNPDLTARFARDAGSKLILGDPNEIAHHGPLLFQLMAADARQGDSIGVREGRRRLRAWLQARDNEAKRQTLEGIHPHRWELGAEDVAAWIYATLLTEGPAEAFRDLHRMRPPTFALSAALELVPRAIAEGHQQLVRGLADFVPSGWAAFVLVPLAAAGLPINHQKLAHSLKSLHRRGFANLGAFAARTVSEEAYELPILDLILTGCELAIASGTSTAAIERILESFHDPEVRRIDRRHPFQSGLLDLLIRAHCLRRLLDGADSPADLFTPRPPPPDEGPAKKTSHPDRHEEDHDQQLREFVQPFLVTYWARARALHTRLSDDELDSGLDAGVSALKSESWRLDRRYEAHGLRSRLAVSLSALIGAGVAPALALRQVLAVSRGWGGLTPSFRQQAFMRFAPTASLHGTLVADLAAAVKRRRAERAGAEEKARDIASYAEMLALVSPSDARAVFQSVIEVANELDTEVMDQLKLISAWLDRGQDALAKAADPVAATFSEVVLDAGIRLDGHDGFPWFASLTALGRLDWPMALACAARWQDASYVGLGTTLEPVVLVGLANRTINSAQGAALLGFERSISDETLEQLCETAQSEGRWNVIAEELARDHLLNRLEFDAAALLAWSPSGAQAGPFVERLRSQQEFIREHPLRSTSSTSPSEARARTVLENYVWDAGAFVDAKRLKEALDAVLAASRDENQWVSATEALGYARPHVPMASRVDHLDAIVQLIAEGSHALDIDALFSALDEWSGGPAVEAWRRQRIHNLLIEHLPEVLQYFPWGDRGLRSALRHAGEDASVLQDVLLSGLERHVSAMSAARVFALAGVIGQYLAPENAAELARWYVRRLGERLVPEAKEAPEQPLRAGSAVEAVGRFLFASMSDIDQRYRWRSAHAARRLARLNDKSALDALCSEYERLDDPAFRVPDAPFYWVSARTWMVIALDRIALETPEMAAASGELLLRVALDGRFPHLLIRSFACDAVRKLIASGHLNVAADVLKSLDQVNKPALSRAPAKTARWGEMDGAQGKRFHFDSMDTLRYWYPPARRAFADVTGEEFLEAAERWIIDAWHARPSEGWQDEPRKQRFDRISYSLYSHHHGSNPVVERYQSYLEWNAMWCTVGELLQSRALALTKDDQEDELDYLVSREKLTIPPRWLADIVSPTPLVPIFWEGPGADAKAWVQAATDDEFIAKLFPCDRPGEIAVESRVAARSSAFLEEVSITSALVEPETSLSLLRAMQTMDASDYYLPPEGHELEIDVAPFRLKGWLRHQDGDTRADANDVFRNSASRIEARPGPTVTAWRGLQDLGVSVPTWRRADTDGAMFEFDAWGHQRTYSDNERYIDENVRSEGYRLLARCRDVLEFLSDVRMDLIVEVNVERKDSGQYSSLYEKAEVQRAQYDRLFLLRHDGRWEIAERDLGTWAVPS